MPISVSWDDKRPYIINVRHSGTWQWDAIFSLEHQLIEMANTRTTAVYILFDSTGVFSVPPLPAENSLDMKRLSALFSNRNNLITMIVVYGVPDFIQFNLQTRIEMARDWRQDNVYEETNGASKKPRLAWVRVRYANNRAEALAIIDADYTD